MKKLLILSAIILIIALALPSFAQSGTILEPNTPVLGELTQESPEVAYKFAATAGQVVVIELKPTEVFGDFSLPKVTLTATSGDIIAQYEGFSSAVIAYRFSGDASYGIIVGRGDETSVGEYTITAYVPEILQAGESIEGTLAEDVISYYAVESEEAFAISIERTSGDINPLVTINNLWSDYTFWEVASLGGTSVIGGAIAIEPDLDSPEPGLYIIEVQRAYFDFTSEDALAEYSITLE